MTIPNRPRYATRLNAFKRKGDTVADMIARAGEVGGLNAADLNFPDHFDHHSPAELGEVLQKSNMALNGLAMWQQEARDRRRAAAPRDETAFTTALRQLSARRGMLRLLAVIALGTAGFGMADVLLEPFGGQVLSMTVAQTTRLTVVMACGSLVGFALASRWLGRDGWQPMTVALMGAAIGIPAFGLVMASAALLISTTIRLSAFARRRELGIMRLVGASNFYIQLPFILEGVLAAIIGSLLAGGAVIAIVQFFVQGYLAERLPFTSFVGLSDGLIVVPVLLVAGIVLAALASGLAIRRYLRI